MKFRKKNHRILEYLDKISNGLISAVKPEKVVKKDGALEGEEGFSLKYIDTGDDVKFMVLYSDYQSPIGKIGLNIIMHQKTTKDHFEELFLKKDVLDEFLLKLNNMNEGILEAMVNDSVEKRKIDPTDESSKYVNLTRFNLEIFPNGPYYSFNIEAKKGIFSFSQLELDNEPDRSGDFIKFSKNIKVDDMVITLKGKLGAKLAYKKITKEEAIETARNQLQKIMSQGVFNYLPNDLKIKKATLQEGLKEFVAEDGIGKLSFETIMSINENIVHTTGDSFVYEIKGKYEEKEEILEAYGCRVWYDKGVTELCGSPLLIIKLGRELAGKEDYGLLK